MKTWTPTSMHTVNLQHPNWSGRAFRTAREALGFGLEWPGYDTQAKPSRGWVIALALAVVGLVVIILKGAA